MGPQMLTGDQKKSRFDISKYVLLSMKMTLRNFYIEL